MREWQSSPPETLGLCPASSLKISIVLVGQVRMRHTTSVVLVVRIQLVKKMPQGRNGQEAWTLSGTNVGLHAWQIRPDTSRFLLISRQRLGLRGLGCAMSREHMLQDKLQTRVDRLHARTFSRSVEEKAALTRKHRIHAVTCSKASYCHGCSWCHVYCASPLSSICEVILDTSTLWMFSRVEDTKWFGLNMCLFNVLMVFIYFSCCCAPQFCSPAKQRGCCALLGSLLLRLVDKKLFLLVDAEF
jgi:hypothetical protein